MSLILYAHCKVSARNYMSARDKRIFLLSLCNFHSLFTLSFVLMAQIKHSSLTSYISIYSNSTHNIHTNKHSYRHIRGRTNYSAVRITMKQINELIQESHTNNATIPQTASTNILWIIIIYINLTYYCQWLTNTNNTQTFLHILDEIMILNF